MTNLNFFGFLSFFLIRKGSLVIDAYVEFSTTVRANEIARVALGLTSLASEGCLQIGTDCITLTEDPIVYNVDGDPVSGVYVFFWLVKYDR